MMTNKGYYVSSKGYYIPKYLFRRKIEIVRKKIIRRKYGYLFYRKTVSLILPSQAENHYEMSLQKKYFNKWILHWYEERIEWKLMIRAEIHHNLSLQQVVLRRWKCFHIYHKTRRIKEEIAAIHFQKNDRKLLLCFCFHKWKAYVEYKVQKYEQIKAAWSFFKSKYKPQMLRGYFRRWCIFTSVGKKNKLRLLEAKQFFEHKLVSTIFLKLVLYVNKKKNEKYIIEEVMKFYEKNLMKKIMNFWFLFTTRKQQEALNVILAETHYCYKLKLNCFSQFLEFTRRNQFIRCTLERINNLQNNRLKTVYFANLKNYTQGRIIKRKTMLSVTIHWKKILMKKTIKYWKLYVQRCQEHKLKQQQILQIAILQINLNKMKFAFKKWKLFQAQKIRKRSKAYFAECFYSKCICRRSFKIWTQFFNYKKTRVCLKTNAINLYYHSLIRMSLNMWRMYIIEEKNFRQKLQQAKNYYQHNIISEGLLLIMKAGLNKKEENLKKSKEKFDHQLFLAQKYLSTWKQNSLYKNVDSMGINRSEGVSLDENKENIPQVSNFEWYQICFLTPRVPKNYLKDHFENL